MLDQFGKLVRDIRITRSLLLYDMAKTLDISSAELSAIECSKKSQFPLGSFLRVKSTLASVRPVRWRDSRFEARLFLMAYGLINKLRNGKNAITFAELRDMARKLQDELNTSDADGVVLAYFDKALYEWSDYFTSVEVNGDYYVKCAPEVGLHDLESRFIGYLPLEIIEVMMRV